MVEISPDYIYQKLLELPDYGQNEREASSIIQTLQKYSYYNLDKTDKDGKVLLYHAVRNYNIDIIITLLSAGANVNTNDKYNKTLLHYAIIYHDGVWSNLEVVLTLLNAGAEVNIKDEDGRTPLHLAASSNHENITKLLIKQGAYINTKDNKNRTPLHLATSHNYINMASLLIKQGANILVKDIFGKKPIDMCCNKKTIELLSQHAEAKHKQYKMATAILVGLDVAIIAAIGTAIYFKKNNPLLNMILPIFIILLSFVITATAYTFKEQIAFKKAITTELEEVKVNQVSKDKKVTSPKM